MSQFKSNIDIAGLITSSLCAVHCMAIPVFLSFGMMEGFVGAHHHIIDITVFFISFVLAGSSILNGVRTHANWWPSFGFILGFGLLAVGLTQHAHVMMAIGGALVASTHFFNYKLMRAYCTH